MDQQTTSNNSPTILQMAANLTSTAVSAVQHVVRTGVVFVSDEKAAERLKICENCEFLDKNIYRCMKCGCMMKAKARVEVAKCPVGKW